MIAVAGWRISRVVGCVSSRMHLLEVIHVASSTSRTHLTCRSRCTITNHKVATDLEFVADCEHNVAEAGQDAWLDIAVDVIAL